MDDDMKSFLTGIGCAALAIVVFVFCCMWAYPHYNVYSQRMAGEAQLAHAEFSKKVAVETSRAKADSAELEAKAEVIRAKGVAAANLIIGESLHNNPEYLKYLWLTGIDHESAKTIIYIPTEANMPLLEASRLAPIPVPQAK